MRYGVKQNKTNIIILEKDEQTKPNGTKSIWFYNLKEDGFDLNSDFRTEIERNDIPDLLNRWSDKLDGAKSWSIDIETIKKKNYDLVVKTYKTITQYTSQYNLEYFSEIMVQNKAIITINDKKQYQRITVKLYGQGVFSRDVTYGKKIKTKEQQLTKTNQFIVAEIDAKLGAFGIIPNSLSNSIVSSHYFLFDLDTDKVLPEYFDYIIRCGPYTEMIQPYVKGTTNYASIRPKHILKLQIPLPTIIQQKKILETINEKKQHLTKLEKSKDHEDLDDLTFSQKQKILNKLGILNDDLNHELKIINQIRNTFAHEIDPLKNKTPDLIKEFKFYDEIKMPKADNPYSQEAVDGLVLGMITGILMRYLAETLWKTDCKK